MALPSYGESVITAVGKVIQNVTLPQFVFGGINASAQRIQKITTTYSNHNWRSSVYRFDRPFDITKISFAVYPAIAANMTIIPVLYFDDENNSSIGTTINSTNYSNSEQEISLYPGNFAHKVRGEHDFFLEFQFTGTALATIGLPVRIEIEELDI